MLNYAATVPIVAVAVAVVVVVVVANRLLSYAHAR
jgi:hypothetical protein